MIRRLKSGFARARRFARRRPVTSVLLLAVALVVLVAGGVYAHAVREWHRAQTAVREGRPAEAKKRLAICLRVWPRDPDVHRLAARAARQTGDFITCEEHLNACLRLEGASEETQLEFLLMRAETGEIEEVRELLQRLVDAGHRESELILETMALVYMHHLRFGPAYATLKQWLDRFPNAARAYHYRGWVLEHMKQPGRAVADYLRALELDPGMDRTRLRVAEIYLLDNEPLQALPHLDYLMARNPDRPEVLARLGQCRFLQGQHAEARRLLEAAFVHMPDDPMVLLHLARLDIEDGQPVRAEERLRHALEIDPADTEARFSLVTALQRQRRDDDAKRELAEFERYKDLLDRTNHLLQEEAKHPSDDPRPAAEIGRLLLQIRQDRQGVYWMEEALSRDPQYQPAHRELAEYYEKKGDKERAAYHRRQLSK